MNIKDIYLAGAAAALEKVANLSPEQADRYVRAKHEEGDEDWSWAAAGGVGAGLAEGLGDFIPGISGYAAVLPGAALGYSASKLKNAFKSPDHLYKRNGEDTGRKHGGLLGGALGGLAGAGLGAGAGYLAGDTNIGTLAGAGLGGILGQGLGQTLGDYATERTNSANYRNAKKRLGDDIEAGKVPR